MNSCEIILIHEWIIEMEKRMIKWMKECIKKETDNDNDNNSNQDALSVWFDMCILSVYRESLGIPFSQLQETPNKS